jgi:hypothetical protein
MTEKKDRRFYNSLQYVALGLGPTFVFVFEWNWWAKGLAFLFLFGVSSALMDIRGLLLKPEESRADLGGGEKY